MKNEKVYLAEDMMKDIKKAQFKVKMKKTWNGVKRWVVRNKEVIIALAPVVVGLLTITVKTVGKSINTTKAKNVKELYCYDPALGHYWELRRKLKNGDWIEIQKRKAAGEKLGDILESMKVLK